MRELWMMTTRWLPEDTAISAFLVINILRWTVGVCLAGLFFCCLITSIPVSMCFGNIFCTAIYAGIIFGLIGGIVFLMRR